MPVYDSGVSRKEVLDVKKMMCFMRKMSLKRENMVLLTCKIFLKVREKGVFLACQYDHTILGCTMEPAALRPTRPLPQPSRMLNCGKTINGLGKAVNSTSYESMVGSLPYATMAARPDIAHAVRVVSKFNSKLIEAHLTAVKRILKYRERLI